MPRIRAQLDHPILDGDGQWIESVPLLVDYLRDVRGTQMAEHYAASHARRRARYEGAIFCVL